MSQIHHGTLTSEGNRNLVLSGSDCRGRVIRNSNSKINCEASDNVEIMDSRNVNANIIGSTLKAMNQLNCELSAVASNIYMESDKNINVQAEDAWCVFQENANFKYQGKGGVNEFLSKFIDNRNCDVTGKDNCIVAIENRNLVIKGDNNRLEISGTRNHDIRPATNESTG